MVLSLNLCLVGEVQWNKRAWVCAGEITREQCTHTWAQIHRHSGQCSACMPSSWPGYLVHTSILGAGQGPEDPRGILDWDGSSSNRSSSGGSHCPGRKGRNLMSLMLGPVVRGQPSHPSLEPVPVASAPILTLQPEDQNRNYLGSASKHFSELLQKESVDCEL